MSFYAKDGRKNLKNLRDYKFWQVWKLSWSFYFSCSLNYVISPHLLIISRYWSSNLKSSFSLISGNFKLLIIIHTCYSETRKTLEDDITSKANTVIVVYSNTMKTPFYFDFQKAFQTSWIDRNRNLSIYNLFRIRKKACKKLKLE